MVKMVVKQKKNRITRKVKIDWVGGEGALEEEKEVLKEKRTIGG